MLSSKKSLTDITSHLLILLLTTLFMALTACSGGNSVDTAPVDNKGGVQLPRALKTSLPANGELSAYLIVDNGERQRMTIDGDRANLRITGLSEGMHTFVVVFEFILDTNIDEPLVVSRALKEIPVGAGNNTLNILDTDYVTSFDVDNDGESNLEELAKNSSPFAGFKVSPISGNTTEVGTTANFTVVLTRQPSTDVTINLSSTDIGEGVPDRNSLTFTAANWDQPQIITVRGVNDNNIDGNAGYTIKLDNVVSNDINYNGQTIAEVPVINIDNDGAGFNVSPISRDTVENGTNATFTVQLTNQPTADVNITLSSSNTAEGKIDKSILRFNTVNWNTPQLITVTGQDDILLDGDQRYEINFNAAISNDVTYNGLVPPRVTIINKDDDTIPLVDFVMPSQSVLESDGTVGFAITIQSVSTRDVTIPYTLSGTANTSDHTLVNGEIIIPAGQTLGSARFNIRNDSQIEPTETIIITMGNPINGTKGGITTHTVRILNNDYTIGGRITGLTGQLSLQNNRGNTLNIIADGDFTFSNALNDGQLYNVVATTQPTNQTCVIQNASGALSGNNVTDLIINCIANDLLKPKPRSTRVILNNADVGADSYNIYYSTTKGFDPNNIASAANGQSITNITAGTDVIANNLKNGTAYYFVLEMIFGGEVVQLPEVSSRPNEWVFDTAIESMDTAVDGTVYFGGHFSSVGTLVGGLVPINSLTGELAYGDFPIVNGGIGAIKSDGQGGWYIGGSFTKVDGVARKGLAHILNNGNVDLNWNPNIVSTTGIAVVYSISLSNGVVYVGGHFSTINGATRDNLAAVDGNGLVTNWNPSVTGSTNVQIRSIVIDNGIVYVSGSFDAVGGLVRNNLAAVNISDGLVTNWNPDANGVVYSMGIDGNNIYIGGEFTSIGSVVRNRLASISLNDVLNSWNPNANGRVNTLIFNNGTVYVGGIFNSVNGQSRLGLAAVLADATGTLFTGWNPRAENILRDVFSLNMANNVIYAGGSTKFVNNSLDTSTLIKISINGVVDPEFRSTYSSIAVIAIDQDIVYAGGFQNAVDSVTRNYLAAINPDRTLSNWNPGADNSIQEVVVDGNQVYIGGEFSVVNGVSRNRLASISTNVNATVTSWNPNLNGIVFTILVDGSVIYVGGQFTTVGGVVRNRLAAINKSDASVLNWNPDANLDVLALDIDGAGTSATIYAGGVFTSIGGVVRNFVASIGASGSLTIWNPDANSTVSALAVNGATVYLGGRFTSLGVNAATPTIRNYLAAIDTNGVINNWNPDADDGVESLIVNNNIIYVGGAFKTVGGVARESVAAIGVNGVLSDIWKPKLSFSNLGSLKSFGSTVYISSRLGDFATVGTDGVIK